MLVKSEFESTTTWGDTAGFKILNNSSEINIDSDAFKLKQIGGETWSRPCPTSGPEGVRAASSSISNSTRINSDLRIRNQLVRTSTFNYCHSNCPYKRSLSLSASFIFESSFSDPFYGMWMVKCQQYSNARQSLTSTITIAMDFE